MCKDWIFGKDGKPTSCLFVREGRDMDNDRFLACIEICAIKEPGKYSFGDRVELKDKSEPVIRLGFEDVRSLDAFVRSIEMVKDILVDAEKRGSEEADHESRTSD